MTDFESKMTNFIFKTNFWKYQDDHFWPENDNEMTNGSWFRLKIVIFQIATLKIVFIYHMHLLEGVFGPKSSVLNSFWTFESINYSLLFIFIVVEQIIIWVDNKG